MPAAAKDRISVVRGQALVPLLPATQREQARIMQPWRGVLLERHKVGAIEIPEHEHREFCLHLQLSGTPEMEWWSEGKNRVEQTSPGSMILLAPGTRDRLHWQASSERLILSLQPDLLNRTAEELSIKAGADFENRWSLRDPALENLLLEMHKQAEAEWPLGSLYADLLASGLATSVLRRYGAGAVPALSASGKLPLPKLRRAMDYITENLHRDLRLEEIAHELELSPFHFARVFRESSGQTPYQYLLDQRIARAKALLRLGTTPVQDIAKESGFTSPASFVRAFRERVGVTPGEWRKAI